MEDNKNSEEYNELIDSIPNASELQEKFDKRNEEEENVKIHNELLAFKRRIEEIKKSGAKPFPFIFHGSLSSKTLILLKKKGYMIVSKRFSHDLDSPSTMPQWTVDLPQKHSLGAIFS